MKPVVLPTLMILIGFSAMFLGLRWRRQLPRGKLIYIDSASFKQPAKTYYDPETDLSGRPDYILHTREGEVPVEVKSSKAPHQPHEGHILQLAAYCRLIESASGRRPSHGIIRYHNRSFRINNNKALQRTLIEALKAIRKLRDAPPDRSHNQANRCQACGYQLACDQSLT